MMNDDDEMPMTAEDADLDLLESHLDGGLDPAAAAALRVRLAADPGLAALLGELQEQRTVRQAAFAAMEPDQTAVDRLNWRVRGAVAATVDRPVRPWWSIRPDPWGVTRFTGAAAACVLLGFFGGHLARGPAPAVTAVSTQPPQSSFVAVGPAGGGLVDVPITDDYGRVVAHQHFATPDQARGFLDDLRRAHDGPSSAVGDGSQARTVSELQY